MANIFFPNKDTFIIIIIIIIIIHKCESLDMSCNVSEVEDCKRVFSVCLRDEDLWVFVSLTWTQRKPEVTSLSDVNVSVTGFT